MKVHKAIPFVTIYNAFKVYAILLDGKAFIFLDKKTVTVTRNISDMHAFGWERIKDRRKYES